MPNPAPAVLAQIPLFRRVSPEDRERIAALAVMRSYERGDKVFDEGDPSETFFIVVTGRIKVFKHAPNGSDIILEIFGPGGPLGAVAAYESRPYPASAAAIEPATCLLIPRQAFFTLLERHPSLVRGLLGSLSMRLVELTNRLAELTGGRIEVRFARLFLKLSEQLGKPDRGGTFIPLALSRQELADLTGTTLYTVSRTLAKWESLGLIESRKRLIFVRSAKRLEEVACAEED